MLVIKNNLYAYLKLCLFKNLVFELCLLMLSLSFLMKYISASFTVICWRTLLRINLFLQVALQINSILPLDDPVM